MCVPLLKCRSVCVCNSMCASLEASAFVCVSIEVYVCSPVCVSITAGSLLRLS